MYKRFIAFAVAVILLLAFCPTFAKQAEDINAASEKADKFWDSMKPYEQKLLAEGLDNDELTDRAYDLYASDPRVSGLKRTDNGFTFYIGSIPCAYNINVRIHALTETEGRGLDETITINSPTRARGRDVFLIGPYYGYQSSFTNYYKNLATTLSNELGGTLTVLSGNNATGPAIKAYFAQAQNTAVVFFDSHGLSENGSSYLCLHSNTGLTQEDYSKGWALSISSGYYGIDGRYMTNGMEYKLNDTFIWCAICEGMMTNGICYPFRQCGAGVVYGYSQSVSFTGDYEYAGAFWPEMIKGSTVAEAIAVMKQKYGNYDSYVSPRAYPIVVSAQDSYPSNPDSVQTVRSTWTLAAPDPVYYTVTFTDWDDTVLSVQTIEEGHAAQAPASPEREGYTFSGWDRAFAYVQSDLTVKALYNINSYYLTYYIDGAQYDKISYKYNEEITVLEEPEKVGHTFSGWSDIPTNMPAHDVEVYGTFEANTYTVTFVDMDDSVISEETVKYGEAAHAPEAPVHEGYDFAGWDRDTSKITSDMTVKALYDVQTFTVTFVDFDDTILDTQIVNYAEAAKAPANPERDGYIFDGWDADFSSVKSDMTVKALYSEAPAALLGDINEDGTVNTADAVLILKYAAGIITFDNSQLTIADVNRNSSVNTADATFILKYAAGMIQEI